MGIFIAEWRDIKEWQYFGVRLVHSLVILVSCFLHNDLSGGWWQLVDVMWQLAYVMGQFEWLTCPRKVCFLLDPYIIWCSALTVSKCTSILYLDDELVSVKCSYYNGIVLDTKWVCFRTCLLVGYTVTLDHFSSQNITQSLLQFQIGWGSSLPLFWSTPCSLWCLVFICLAVDRSWSIGVCRVIERWSYY